MFKREDAGHERLEEGEAPHEAAESNGPGLASRLSRFIEHWVAMLEARVNDRMEAKLTKHKLVLVHQIRHSKVHRSKDQDQRLDNTIDDRDDEDKDR